MKKTLLLSVVASTMIIAGGDIAPVEPVVEAPVAASSWDFDGQAALYYQTNDEYKVYDGTASNNIFRDDNSWANAGVQLRAVNKNLFAGVGAGVELTGLGTLDLHNGVVTNIMQSADGSLNGGAVTQAYLTYAAGNTAIKVGRQTLPKALSPFAFSENWNVFKNTFGALTVVNTDIEDTTLVYAYVHDKNSNGNLADFNKCNGHDGVHMLTVQNKMIDGLALTGTYYFGDDFGAEAAKDANDGALQVIWGDAAFNAYGATVAVQGGTVQYGEETVAYGAKVGYDFGFAKTSVAYSSVNKGTTGVFNAGGVKTPLYTQMILNQGAIANDADYVKVAASADLLGGKFGAAYGLTTYGGSEKDAAKPQEVDVTYSTKLTDSVSLLTAYVWTDSDEGTKNDATNYVRVVARYNF